MEKSVRKYNKLFIFLIYWSIAVQCLLYFIFKSNPIYKDLPEYVTTIEALIYMLNIFALLVIKSEYRFGFWLFIGLRVVHELLWISYDPVYAPIVEDLSSSIILCLMLLLKKNGVSGWKVLFTKKD